MSDKSCAATHRAQTPTAAKPAWRSPGVRALATLSQPACAGHAAAAREFKLLRQAVRSGWTVLSRFAHQDKRPADRDRGCRPRTKGWHPWPSV